MIKQVGLNKSPEAWWFTIWNIFKAYVGPYSDGSIQQLVYPRSYFWLNHQGCDFITEERWQAYLVGGLDDKPITLLDKELKILARALANRLPIVGSDLIGTEQNLAMKCLFVCLGFIPYQPLWVFQYQICFWYIYMYSFSYI